MNKTVRPEANEQLLAELGSLISVVEPGQMRKLASSNSMTRDMLNQHKPDKDHFLIHVIGLGDYETYGFNRNADAFTKQANQDYHHTFVSDGHMFREHNNSNPSLKIGDIKASVHNDDMNRVELAVWGHKKKASDVRDKLHAGEPISVSMSCTLPFDVDSCTGKKARSPAEYEPHMRRTPGQFVPGFNKYAFVYNPNPRFFDISYVKRPADRIAHHLEHFLGDEDNVEMAKAASEHGVVSGALLAEIEGVTTPDWLNTSGIHNPTKRGILQKLAKAEKDFHNALSGEATSDLVNFVKEAAAYAFDGTDDLTDSEINTLRRVQPETLFQELGKRAAFLPFRTFLSYATGKTLRELDVEPAVKEAALMLPDVFDLMEHDCVVEDETMFDGHKSAFLSRADLANTDEVQRVFDKCDERYSAKTEKVKPRAVMIRITTTKTVEPEEKKEKQEKKAFANDTLAAKYAQLYGLYKVAAVEQATKDANYTLDNQFFMYLISQHNL